MKAFQSIRHGKFLSAVLTVSFALPAMSTRAVPAAALALTVATSFVSSDAHAKKHSDDDEEDDDSKPKRKKSNEPAGPCDNASAVGDGTVCNAAAIAAQSGEVAKGLGATAFGIANQVKQQDYMNNAMQKNTQSAYMQAGVDAQRDAAKSTDTMGKIQYYLGAAQGLLSGWSFLKQNDHNTESADLKKTGAALGDDAMKQKALEEKRAAAEYGKVALEAGVAAVKSAADGAQLQLQAQMMNKSADANQKIADTIKDAEKNQPKVVTDFSLNDGSNSNSAGSGPSGDKSLPGESSDAVAKKQDPTDPNAVAPPPDVAAPINLTGYDSGSGPSGPGPNPGNYVTPQGPAGGSGSDSSGYSVGGGGGGGAGAPSAAGAGGGDAQYAGMMKNPGVYTTANAGSTGASTSGGGKSGGGIGDVANLFSKLLTQEKPEDKEKKNKMMNFGERSLASLDPNQSLLDSGVNIFERVHKAYQEKQRQNRVGQN